jgi:hypothetical protein
MFTGCSSARGWRRHRIARQSLEIYSRLTLADAQWTSWAVLVWIAVRLFNVANLPVTQHLSPEQTAALQDRLMVLAVILTMVQIIFMMDGNRDYSRRAG